MSDISAAEKQRILRERRQAKMARGNASDRLNSILSQGSSVKATSAVSVLDKPPSPAPTSSKDADADPDVSDIEHIINSRNTDTPLLPEQPDIDEILNKMLNGGVPRPGQENQGQDPFSQMLHMFQNQDGSLPGPEMASEDTSYETQLAAYHLYQQKVWRARFLVVRFVAVFANFFYHYLTVPDHSFLSSSYSYVRGLTPQTPVQSFIGWFLTAELVIMTSFYLISSHNHLFRAASDRSFIMKGLSMGSMLIPQVARFQPLVRQMLGYWELVSILVGDVSLVVVLFGLVSFQR